MEEIDQKAFDSSQLLRHLPLLSIEDQARLAVCSNLLVFKFLQASELLHAKLNHVEDLIVIHSPHDDVVWAFLRVRSEHEQVTIVLGEQCLERIRVVERGDVIVACQGFAVWLLECAEIFKNVLDVG